MHITGPANWWMPAWLDRILPNLSVEVDEAAPSHQAELEPVL
jgi:putative drug exporter of the RND superfamily